MCEIERAPGDGASTSSAEYNKGKVEGHILEVRRLLGALNAPGSPLNENLSACEPGLHFKPVGPHGASISPASESGMPLATPR